jgi:hypothetical protein
MRCLLQNSTCDSTAPPIPDYLPYLVNNRKSRQYLRLREALSVNSNPLPAGIENASKRSMSFGSRREIELRLE